MSSNGLSLFLLWARTPKVGRRFRVSVGNLRVIDIRSAHFIDLRLELLQKVLFHNVLPFKKFSGAMTLFTDLYDKTTKPDGPHVPNALTEKHRGRVARLSYVFDVPGVRTGEALPEQRPERIRQVRQVLTRNSLFRTNATAVAWKKRTR